MKTQIILHLGMHKTATTFLQEAVFPRIAKQNQNINYINIFDISNQIKPNQINIISDENLDGGSYRLPSDHNKRTIIATNLSKMYPDAKVILCIRNKNKWIKSAYKQFVLGYGAKDHTFTKYQKALGPEILNFESYINLLKLLFDDIYVCHFEDLVIAPRRFVKGICKFIGVDVPVGINYNRRNISLKSYQIPAIRLISKLVVRREFYFPFSVLIKLIRGDVKFGEWNRKV